MFFAFTSVAQVKWNVHTDTSYKWFYENGDEFTNLEIDQTKWIKSLPWSRNVVSSGCYYKDENTYADSGYVFFKADRYQKYEPLMEWELKDSYVKKHPERQKDNTYFFDYSGGLLWSKDSYKFGQFEIRFKSPRGSGLWPAFWLYGGNPNYEIDFFELKGEKNNQMHVDVHCPSGCADYRNSIIDMSKGWGHWIKTTNYFDNDFNIISGIWNENGISFYLNEKYVAYFKGKFDLKMNLTAGIGIAQNDGPFKPGENKYTNFPSTLIVDYIRVWSDKDTIYDVKDKYKLFEYSNKINSLSTSQAFPKNKKAKNSKKSNFDNRVGSITLLPIFYNRYSLSIAGKNLGNIQVDILDRFDKKVAGFNIENMEYYVMDLSALDTGPYKVKINVLNQILVQEIPVLNSKKFGEEK